MKNMGENHTLSNSIRKGITGALLTQSSKLVLSIISLPVLARYLSPSDFGHFAIIFAIYLVLDLFRDFGMSISQMRIKEISYSERSSFFWISIMSSITFYALSLVIFELVTKSFNLPHQIFQFMILNLVLVV